jgi:hypothetical protein
VYKQQRPSLRAATVFSHIRDFDIKYVAVLTVNVGFKIDSFPSSSDLLPEGLS